MLPYTIHTLATQIPNNKNHNSFQVSHPCKYSSTRPHQVQLLPAFPTNYCHRQNSLNSGNSTYFKLLSINRQLMTNLGIQKKRETTNFYGSTFCLPFPVSAAVRDLSSPPFYLNCSCFPCSLHSVPPKPFSEATQKARVSA